MSADHWTFYIFILNRCLGSKQKGRVKALSLSCSLTDWLQITHLCFCIKTNFIFTWSYPHLSNASLYSKSEDPALQQIQLFSYAAKLIALKKHPSYGAVHQPSLKWRFLINPRQPIWQVLDSRSFWKHFISPHPPSYLLESPIRHHSW